MNAARKSPNRRFIYVSDKDFQLYEEAEALAREAHQSFSALVAEAISEYLHTVHINKIEEDYAKSV